MIKRNSGANNTLFQQHQMQGQRSEKTLGKNDSECSFTLTDDEDRENYDG